jgi:hypothetical protein
MAYYVGMFIRELSKEKFFELDETFIRFAAKIEKTEKDLLLVTSDEVGIISCLLKMKENYPDAHFGISKYVGIAKGLAKIAEVGEILVSEEVERKIIEDYEITSLGMLSIAGMSSQILVYRVESSLKKLQFPAVRPRSELIPKTAEIEGLNNILRVSNAVLVTGTPGSGLTTFLDQFVEKVQDREVFRTVCPSYISCITFKTITDIVRKILGLSGGVAIDEKQSVVERRLKELEMSDIGTSYLAILDFLGLGEEESILEKMELKTRVEIIVNTVAEIVRRLSWVRPVMIIIEDVEYMDASSVNFVQSLIKGLIEERVCFIFSSSAPQTNILGMKTFELRNIKKEELTQLVEDGIGERISLPPTTPFQVGQYLLLYNEEIISFYYNQYRGETTITDFGLSFYDLKTIIKRRLELLGERKEFLFNLAMAGSEVVPDELPIDKKNHISFDFFVKAKYLKKEHDRYLFTSPLLHNEIYVLVPDKVKRHQRLADYYSRIQGFEEYAAFHYREGENYKKAIEFLKKSGDLAVRRGGHESGIFYYSQALDLCQRQGEAVDLEILVALNENLADVYRALGEEKKALKYYKIVLDSYKEILRE